MPYRMTFFTRYFHIMSLCHNSYFPEGGKIAGGKASVIRYFETLITTIMKRLRQFKRQWKHTPPPRTLGKVRMGI